MSEWAHVRTQQEITRRIHHELVGMLMTSQTSDGLKTENKHSIIISGWNRRAKQAENTEENKIFERQRDLRILSDNVPGGCWYYITFHLAETFVTALQVSFCCCERVRTPLSGHFPRSISECASINISVSCLFDSCKTQRVFGFIGGCLFQISWPVAVSSWMQLIFIFSSKCQKASSSGLEEYLNK